MNFFQSVSSAVAFGGTNFLNLPQPNSTSYEDEQLKGEYISRLC